MTTKTTDLLTCAKCGKAMSKPSTGRPPRWCSTGCRRSAEREIRRLDRRLESLETQRVDLKSDRSGLRDMGGRSPEQQVAANAEAIEEAEARLKRLLDDDVEPADFEPARPR